MTPEDFAKELRAWRLLLWNPYSLDAEFDEDTAAKKEYTKFQKERSDRALNDVPEYETSLELAAFHELERLGVFTQDDFFSPTKAKDGYYKRRLKSVLERRTAQDGRARGGSARTQNGQRAHRRR